VSDGLATAVAYAAPSHVADVAALSLSAAAFLALASGPGGRYCVAFAKDDPAGALLAAFRLT
jgi:hypothetical protein